MKNLMLLTLLTLTNQALADVCTPAESVPRCPQNGSQLVDDTYPSRAIVMSGVGVHNTVASASLPAQMMAETFRAYRSNPERTPFIIFTGTDEAFTQVRTATRANLINLGLAEAEADRLVSERLRRAPGSASYTWQQDYFESMVNPRTGAPVLRFNRAYDAREVDSNGQDHHRENLAAIAGAGICGVTRGTDLQSVIAGPASRDKSAPQPQGSENQTPGNSIVTGRLEGSAINEDGESGGNIEGLPGGLCLIGDTALSPFGNEFCGGAQNVVRIESSWLEVGHVDEIFKVLPRRNTSDNRPPECAFSILAADTRLGSSLLRTPSAEASPLVNISLQHGKDGATYMRSVATTPLGEIMCALANGEQAPARPGRRGEGEGDSRRTFLNFLLPSAFAGTGQAGPPSAFDHWVDRCAPRLNAVTTRQFNQFWHSTEANGLRMYNALIQESLDRSKRVIYDRILAALPQCRPYFRNVASMFTPVPNLFSPRSPDQAMTNVSRVRGNIRPANRSAQSLFPNPTNGLVLNDTVVYPGPVATAYRTGLDEATRSLGLEPRHVDTWDYAHSGGGNLHCASHTLPYCRP